MNIVDLMNETLKTDDTVTLSEEEINEGLFSISPIVALYAFKDKAFHSLENNGFTRAKENINDKVSGLKADVEKTKAKLGLKSGKGDNATVYKFSKEQKKVLAEMYNKYGSSLVKQIQNFRNNIIAPYQIIKRNVAQNSRLTDKEVNGMSREEFYKYRESGRRKIERRKDYYENFSNKGKETEETREALRKAREIYNDFKSGKNTDLTATNIEDVLDKMNLGIDSLGGWSVDELDKTNSRINELEKYMKDPSRKDDEGNIIVSKNKKVLYGRDIRTREEIENEIENLATYGSSKLKKETNPNDSEGKKGSFKKAYANYMLRKEKIKQFRNGTSDDEFKDFYEKILKNAIDDAEERNNSSFDEYAHMRGSIELNKYEKKIWGIKKSAEDKMSGDIDDWYQKITDDDFKGVVNIKKPDSVIKAEAEMDAQIKKFEREIAKTVSPEDLDKLKKYRLIGTPLTVRELKDPNSLFRSSSEISAGKVDRVDESITEEEFREALRNYYNTNFSSFRELDDAKNDIRDMRKHISKDVDEQYRVQIDTFLKRRNLKAQHMSGYDYDDTSSVTIDDIKNFETQCLNKTYSSMNQIEQDKEKFDNMVQKYKKDNSSSDTELMHIDMFTNALEKKFTDSASQLTGNDNE